MWRASSARFGKCSHSVETRAARVSMVKVPTTMTQLLLFQGKESIKIVENRIASCKTQSALENNSRSIQIMESCETLLSSANSRAVIPLRDRLFLLWSRGPVQWVKKTIEKWCISRYNVRNKTCGPEDLRGQIGCLGRSCTIQNFTRVLFIAEDAAYHQAVVSTSEPRNKWPKHKVIVKLTAKKQGQGVLKIKKERTRSF